jgi:nucleoside-diphosphate-sugar epimerase
MLYGLDSISLRFFNVFGPNQIGGSPYSTAVSAWLTSIMKNESMRSDGDGSQTRDMCYVDNVSDACLKSVMTKNDLKAEAINIACGDRTSNKEILQYLLDKFPGSTYHDAPWRPGDVMHTHADISLSEELIGYKPLVKFWDGLDKTIEWYKNNWDTIESLNAKGNI